jgi:outer membrane protein OmpA-like peptidoglycan-associated protein
VINSPSNEGFPAFDSKGTTMFFTLCNGRDGKGASCRLYSAQGQGSEWTNVEVLPFSTDSFNCMHPSLSKDGQTLFFCSDMPGGYGGKDIWSVTYSKRGKTWGDPVNLGPEINTPVHEGFPHIAEDGTLYFSSEGHATIGGLDIMYAKGSGTEWSTPINMKPPMNSGADDFGMISNSNNENGYFSSNREGGRGGDDIYHFYMTPLVFTLSGIARDLNTKEILSNAVLTITNSTDTGKVTVKTDHKGYYKINLKSRTDYELFAAHEDYYDSKIEFQTTKGYEASADLTQDLYLEPFDYKKVFTLEGIYYDLASASIRSDAAVVLDTIVYLMNKYPKIRLELGSHTDCRADSAYNQELSQRRADSAVAYIGSKGIDTARLVAKGYGETMLVNDCACEGTYIKRKCTEEEHQMNRRTTFKLLDNNYVPKKKVVEPPVDPKQKGPAGKGTNNNNNRGTPPPKR